MFFCRTFFFCFMLVLFYVVSFFPFRAALKAGIFCEAKCPEAKFHNVSSTK